MTKRRALMIELNQEQEDDKKTRVRDILIEHWRIQIRAIMPIWMQARLQIGVRRNRLRGKIDVENMLPGEPKACLFG
jgi:hypothetical protein